MTVSAGTIKHVYAGTGAIREWDYTFPINTLDGSDIEVYLTAANGTITGPLTENYSVDVDNSHVIYPTVASLLPLLQAGTKITLLRKEPLTQVSEWKNKGPFDASTLMAAVDKLTMIAQQFNEELSRCIKYPVDEVPASEDTDTLLSLIESYKTDAETAHTAAEAAQAAAEAAQAVAEAAADAIDFSKDDSTDLDGALASNDKVPSQLAVKTYADTKIPKSDIDTDEALTANSDTKVPSQQAVKAYADAAANNKAAKGANSDITSIGGLTTPLSTAQGGTGSSANANAANGVVKLDANSKIPAAQLGAWVDVSAAGDHDDEVAATDGFLIGYNGSGASAEAIVYTDGNNPATTIRTRSWNDSGTANGQFIPFCVPVRKGDHWKITGSVTVAFWIPWGS